MHTLYTDSTVIFKESIRMFKSVTPISLRIHLEQLTLASALVMASSDHVM